MHISALVWLIVFALLMSGIFLFLRGNMHPDGIDVDDNKCKDYKNTGLVLLIGAFVLVCWLYTQEPRVKIIVAS